MGKNNMANNNEQKSILEVFGSKSQDGDKVKGILLNALMRNSYKNGGEVIKPREIRRRESEYPRSEYSYLEPEETEALEALEPFMKELQSFKSKKWSDKSYEAAINYARDKGTNIDRHLIHSALEGLGQWAGRSYEDKFGGTLGFYDDPEGKSKGNLISPLELNELLIEEDIATEKPTHISRQTMGREDLMYPMEKGKGLMALLQRLLPGGKTGMDVARHPTRESFEAVWQSQNPKNK